MKLKTPGRIHFAADDTGLRGTDRRRRADTPLVSLRRRPGWLNGRCLAVAWVALLVYGTLIPFDFQFNGSTHTTGFRWLGPLVIDALGSVTWNPPMGGTQAWVVDLVTNLLLYGPLGLFVRLGAQRHGWRRGWQFSFTLMVLLTVSYVLECTQSLMPSRVASWYDVAMNTTGGLLFSLGAVQTRFCLQRVTFWVYRKVAFVLRTLLAFVGSMRQNRPAVMALVALDGVLVTIWLGTAIAADTAPGGGANWLPFARQFELPYNEAMVQIGAKLVYYGVLSLLLSVQLLTMPIRHRVAWLVLAVAVLTALPRPWAGRAGVFDGDITEPVMALLAVGFLVTVVHVLAHAVRCCDRRRMQVPVELDHRR